MKKSLVCFLLLFSIFSVTMSGTAAPLFNYIEVHNNTGEEQTFLREWDTTEIKPTSMRNNDTSTEKIEFSRFAVICLWYGKLSRGHARCAAVFYNKDNDIGFYSNSDRYYDDDETPDDHTILCQMEFPVKNDLEKVEWIPVNIRNLCKEDKILWTKDSQGEIWSRVLIEKNGKYVPSILTVPMEDRPLKIYYSPNPLPVE